MSEIVIEIPRLAPGLNGPKGLMRMHFNDYANEKKSWCWWFKKAALGVVAPVPCIVEFHRYYGKQPMDIDNAYSTCKIPLDAMRSNGILVEDNPNHVVAISLHQIKVATLKEEKTVIVIKPTPDNL